MKPGQIYRLRNCNLFLLITKVEDATVTYDGYTFGLPPRVDRDQRIQLSFLLTGMFTLAIDTPD